VRDESGSRKLYQLLLADYQVKKHEGTLAELKSQLQDLKIATDHSAPAVKVLDEETVPKQKGAHKVESEPGIGLMPC